jgi:hypothetical protein
LRAIEHHRKAHMALGRAHDYLDLRARHVDPASEFRTPYHDWIEGRCLFMAAWALHVAVEHRHALAVSERARLR